MGYAAVNQGLRLVLCVAIALAACTAKQVPPTDWDTIESLATPPPSHGSSADLERALAITKLNASEWRHHRFDKPPPTVAQFPQGAEAIAALRAWADANGVLPPARDPSNMKMIGGVVADTAESAADLEPAEYLGGRLITDGRNRLEVDAGLSVLHETAHTRKLLKLPAVSPPRLDLVRALAADALHTRGSDDAIDAFWLVALAGARPGEPQETTLARLKAAVDAAPMGVRNRVMQEPNDLRALAQSHDALMMP